MIIEGHADKASLLSSGWQSFANRSRGQAGTGGVEFNEDAAGRLGQTLIGGIVVQGSISQRVGAGRYRLGHDPFPPQFL